MRVAPGHSASRLLAAATVLICLAVVPNVAVAATCSTHWVGSWTASPSDASGEQPLSDQTLRMIVAPHLAGSTLRMHFSNRFGSAPVTLGPISIGIRAGGAALQPGTERNVSFGGHPTVTIAPGSDVISDPVKLRFAAFQDLAISVSVPGLIPDPTEHFNTRQTSYLSPAGSGNHAAETGAGAFTQTTSVGGSSTGWYFLDGIDVLASGSTGAVATFGDSITDGYQGNLTPLTEQLGTIDTNGRYPDDLARRLIAAGIPLSVLNTGISGNRVLQDGQIPMFGPAGITRFRVDALHQAGVTDVVVLEGINDIGQTTGITAAQLIAGYRQLISQAHAAGLRIQLGTLTPSGGTLVATYGDAAADQLRQQVNAWIRGQRLADGVIDFDAAVRDPSDPSRLASAYDGSDHLHFSLAGYRAMAGAVNLGQLRVPACPLSRLQLRVRPRSATAGHPERVLVRVSAPVSGHSGVVRGAVVTLDGHRARTGPSGVAVLRVTLRHSGTWRVRAAARGYLPASATIRVRRGSAAVQHPAPAPTHHHAGGLG